MISTTQAARILDVTPRRVREMIREGKLPAKKVGGVLIINESDLAAFAAGFKKRGTKNENRQK